MISVYAGLVTTEKESSVIRLGHYITQQYFNELISSGFRTQKLQPSGLTRTWYSCSRTGMFALRDPISHVNSAAFAQARLRST